MTIEIQGTATDDQVITESHICIQFYSTSCFHVLKLCLYIRCDLVSFFYGRSCTCIIAYFLYIIPVKANAGILINAHDLNVHTGCNYVLFQIRHSKANLGRFSLSSKDTQFIYMCFITGTFSRICSSIEEILSIFINGPVICTTGLCRSQSIRSNCS